MPNCNTLQWSPYSYTFKTQVQCMQSCWSSWWFNNEFKLSTALSDVYVLCTTTIACWAIYKVVGSTKVRIASPAAATVMVMCELTAPCYKCSGKIFMEGTELVQHTVWIPKAVSCFGLLQIFGTPPHVQSWGQLTYCKQLLLCCLKKTLHACMVGLVTLATITSLSRVWAANKNTIVVLQVNRVQFVLCTQKVWCSWLISEGRMRMRWQWVWHSTYSQQSSRKGC